MRLHGMFNQGAAVEFSKTISSVGMYTEVAYIKSHCIRCYSL